MPRRWPFLLLTALTAPASIAQAQAQEVCVVCREPAATYRCSIEKSEKLTRFGSVGDKALMHVCAKELARLERHTTCTARRDAQGAACDGPSRTISLAAILDAPPEVQGPTAPAPALPPPAPANTPTPAPPATVQELAQRTGETSKKQLKAVGDGIGGAATKTWNCLTSLFTKC